MAKEGVRFTDFHTAQPVCSASPGAAADRVLRQPHRHPRGARADGPPRHRRRRDDARRAVQAEGVRHRLPSASGTSATTRGSCRPATASTRTSACRTPTTCGRTTPRRKRPDGYPNLPLVESDTVIDADVTAADQATLTRAVHGPGGEVHRGEQGEAVLPVLRAQLPARPAVRRREVQGFVEAGALRRRDPGDRRLGRRGPGGARRSTAWSGTRW